MDFKVPSTPGHPEILGLTPYCPGSYKCLHGSHHSAFSLEILQEPSWLPQEWAFTRDGSGGSQAPTRATPGFFQIFLLGINSHPSCRAVPCISSSHSGAVMVVRRGGAQRDATTDARAQPCSVLAAPGAAPAFHSLSPQLCQQQSQGCLRHPSLLTEQIHPGHRREGERDKSAGDPTGSLPV